MLPKMPDMAWLREGGCIAAAQTTDKGAAMLDRIITTKTRNEGKRHV
jgi:hypothetical protein